MRSQTIGLIGFGTIGRLVAERLKSFGGRILIYDPYVDDEEIREKGCIPVTKKELLHQADIISLHGRIQSGEPPLIGEKEMKMMKPESYLINTASAGRYGCTVSDAEGEKNKGSSYRCVPGGAGA